MMGKKKSKIVKEKASAGRKTKTGQPEPKTDDGREAKPFDFGGLPERDLKKNLGCG